MKTQPFAYNIAGMMEETAEDIKMLDMTNFMEEESLILRESQQNMFEPSSFSFMEVEVDTSMSTKKKAFIKKPSVSPYDDNK